MIVSSPAGSGNASNGGDGSTFLVVDGDVIAEAEIIGSFVASLPGIRSGTHNGPVNT